MNTLIKGDERNLALEAFYGQIETEFGKVKDKIISGAEPVQSDIEAVVCFVAAQMVRTPKFRAGWSLAPASGHEAQLDAITDSDLRAAIEGTTANLVKNGQKIFTFLALPRAIKLLGEFRVTLLKTDDEVGFVTSDSPCCVIQYAHQPDQVRRGLHSPTVNVMMSLSRSVVAIFDRSPSEHQMIRLFPDHPIAIEINALLWRGADKWVVLPRCKTARAEWFHEAVRTKLTQYTVA